MTLLGDKQIVSKDNSNFLLLEKNCAQTWFCWFFFPAEKCLINVFDATLQLV